MANGWRAAVSYATGASLLEPQRGRDKLATVGPDDAKVAMRNVSRRVIAANLTSLELELRVVDNGAERVV
jgi:hypothetical protein